MDSVFEYKDYKTYLRDHMAQRAGRGERNRLATAIGCHNGYISQVLNGHSHFSLEQADLINLFLGHSKEESHFFLLLVQFGRAGTVSLREHFQEQMALLREKQFSLKDRLSYKKSLTREDQVTFYSSWHYGAIHVLVSVPTCNTDQGISEYLGLPLEKVREATAFLLSIGLIKSEKGRYVVGPSQIHLDNESPMIAKHHTNWRLRAIQALDERRRENLHYSSVITASVEDSAKIREILVRAIESIRALVRSSVDEDSFVYAVDFFGVRKA